MLVVFPLIFVADTKLIYGNYFAAYLICCIKLIYFTLKMNH